jgi:hypothetical protein
VNVKSSICIILHIEKEAFEPKYHGLRASSGAFLNHSLNYHLESHVHKNRFLYLFILQKFAISYAHSRESFSSSIFA